MKMKLVSAIITTHNRAELLTRAIESTLRQTYKEMEVIVVDDASTDNTREVCGKYPIQYIYIPKAESRGGNYARNLGIRAAKGKYCAFLDDDDYWLPSKTEKQVDLIERMDCELVHCGRRLEFIEETGVRYKDTVPEAYYQGDMRKKILQFICTTTTNILVRREALIDVGMFDETLRFWQEYELTIRLAQRKPFYFVNEPLSVYRVDTRDGNRLTNKYYAWKEAVKYIHHKHANLYNQLTLFQRYNACCLVWKDASSRCKSAGLPMHVIYYKILLLPLRIMIKIKKISQLGNLSHHKNH